MRTFKVTHTKNWIENQLDFVLANSHKEVAAKLELKNKRVYNERYNQIEKTGEYYRITEIPRGKSFIFEVIF